MKRIFLVTIISILLPLAILAQEKVYMPYFETINMSQEYQLSTARLLKMYIEQDSKYELVLPAKDSSYYSETKEQTFANAKALKINHVLIGDLNRMGEKVIVSMIMYNTGNGEKEWTVMQKAITPEDLDPILQKVALSLNGKISINETTDIYNVTNNESKELNKIMANTYFGLEIGGGMTLFDVPRNSPAGFGLVYSGDMRNLIFDIKGSLYFSDVRLSNFSLHINYPLTDKKSTPYFGGGLGFGATTVMKEETYTNYYGYGNPYTYTNQKRYNGSGLTFYAGGGYIFNRTSSTCLRANVNLFYSMYKVDKEYPVGALISLSVLF